jgi:hypothetical protein
MESAMRDNEVRIAAERIIGVVATWKPYLP